MGTYECYVNKFKWEILIKSANKFKVREDNSIRGIIKYMKELPHLIPLRILMIAPATNPVSKRSASCLRRLKNWLRSTMSQERLNYLMLLSIHKNKFDELKLIDIANQFCQGNRDNEFMFGKSTINDSSKLLPI